MKRSPLFVAVVPLAIVVFILINFARPPWTPLRIFGLVLALPGFALLTTARFQLGNAFSVTPQATMLVSHGIYSRIRHPVYVFSAIAIAGLVLYMDFPQFLLLFVVLIPLQIMRARREERVLEDRFGEEYRRYKSTTWF